MDQEKTLSRNLGQAMLDHSNCRDALQDLYETKAGPPLIRYEKEWKAAMEKTEAELRKGEK